MASPSRPPDPGGRWVPGPQCRCTKQGLLTFCALLLLLATAQSQSVPDAVHHVRQHPRSIRTESVLRPDGPQPGRSPAEIPLINLDTSTYIKYKNTDDQNADAEKFDAVAPVDSAVRAPLAPRPTESTSLHSLSTARSLQDWEVENIVLLATIDGALHARDRRTGQERWSLAVPESPMIETTHHRQNLSSEDEQPENGYIFIVEPSKDGDLYIQHNNPSIGLQRLGVTVKSLAAQTPSWLDDPPLATTAHVESTLFVIDAASGNVLKQFSSRNMFVNDNQERSCRKVSGLEPEDESCEPFGTLHVGRNQYTITIASAESNQILCTIKYTEWTPNTRDGDLQTQHRESLDNCHIQSYHNGRIIGMDRSQDLAKPYRFTHLLDSPVARVYDVFRPTDNSDGTASLVMLSQPIDPPHLDQLHPWNDEVMRSRVFVNQTGSGDWYALSELSYPGVTSHAPYANVFRDWRHRQMLDFDTDAEDIVGVHTLDQRPSSSQQLIAAYAANENQSKESALAAVDPAQPPATIEQPILDLRSVFFTVIVCTFCFVVLFVQRHPLAKQVNRVLERLGFSIRPVVLKAEPVNHASIPFPDSTEESISLENASTTPLAHSRAQSVITSTAKSVPGSPEKLKRRATLDGNDSSDGDSDFEDSARADDNGLAYQVDEEAPRRKKKRGKRGRGKKGKNKGMNPEDMDETEAIIVQEKPLKDGMMQVGRLKVNTRAEQCLGFGSNGTAVFPGILDGREVAVKRLLRSSTSLAAKEIKHLLSSDENPHVIRYFGKEESANFTFIALDLFTASLDQLIERPEKFPGLATIQQGFDVKDALRQITDGVQHLHSLKLVHRDIKPQNVLTRAVKSVRPVEGPPKLQFVISDFGLCKPLEEGPESTFAPTANHTAAGTTGWRAPELLVHSRAAIATPSATSASGTSKSTTHSCDGFSRDYTVIDPPSGRRATKAIDIFSLGCVFYYVMTQGQHPFDVGGTSLGRDLNIKDNKFTTEGLRLHQYEFDADDLVMQMIKHNPKERPDTARVLQHPYFWDDGDKLGFLCDVSDAYEREKNSIDNIHDTSAIRTPEEENSLTELRALESLGPNVIGPGNDWLKALPRSFVNEMGRQRKYTGSKMIDLLRVIRNKKNHFHDLPEDIKEIMIAKGRSTAGGLTGFAPGKENQQAGYFRFWAEKFPSLVINCHCLILERQLVAKFGLNEYYDTP